MTNINRIFRLLCVVSIFLAGSLGNTSTPVVLIVQKITGELITLEPEAPAEEVDTRSVSSDMPSYEPVDLSDATLTVSYDTTNEEGDTKTVTLFEGPFQGDFTSEVEVPWGPREGKITLQLTAESDPMTIETVIGWAEIHLAFVDRPGPRDQFLLVGSTLQSLNPENKFSVKGDLSFLDIDLTNTTSVEVYAIVYDDEGALHAKQWGPVLVKDDTFLITGDVENPISATLFVHGGHNAQMPLILEPHSQFLVTKLGSQTHELSITSGSGYHAVLVESWQQSKEYLSVLEAYATEYEQYRERRETGEPEPEVAGDDSGVVENKIDIEDTFDSDNSVEILTPVEGCEDAVVQDGESSHSSSSSPKYVSLWQQARDFRNKTLREIAEGDRDPMARYLAIDMRPYEWDDYASQLAALRPLTKTFNRKFVHAAIKPKIEDYEQRLVVVQNDAALIPGQKVPEFTLGNYDGENSALYDLLGENDLVLIDFWASWCGPCIADFPELKKLHAAYADEDFEIVGVSIDSTMEDWKGGVDEHELPWINLGEVKGWEGPVSTMYGVNAIPKGFLVDSQGCIYKKNIRPAALKKFLVDRYGMDESLVEPEEESETTPDVSS